MDDRISLSMSVLDSAFAFLLLPNDIRCLYLFYFHTTVWWFSIMNALNSVNLFLSYKHTYLYSSQWKCTNLYFIDIQNLQMKFPIQIWSIFLIINCPILTFQLIAREGEKHYSVLGKNYMRVDSEHTSYSYIYFILIMVLFRW